MSGPLTGDEQQLVVPVSSKVALWPLVICDGENGPAIECGFCDDSPIAAANAMTDWLRLAELAARVERHMSECEVGPASQPRDAVTTAS